MSLYYLLAIYVDAIFYKQCGIGFSGVIFVLKVLNNVKYPGQSINMFGVIVTLPSGFLVWFEPLLAQLITGNGSFVGHFAGALAGLSYLGMLKPILNVTRLVVVDAPRGAVRYLCPCLLPFPYGAILLSTALLATNADFLPTSELRLEDVAPPSSSSHLVVGEGQ